jgi:uncharacterized protein (TIGR04255 family)
MDGMAREGLKMAIQMSRAPVYFTIAQVRFNSILTLPSYAPSIQDRMRKINFPDFQQNTLTTMNLNVVPISQDEPSQVPVAHTQRFIFSNMEKASGFILDQGALSFHTTEYTHFDSFLATFMDGLSIVHEIITLSYAERVGMRYLNAIFPSDGEDLSDYLIEPMMGLSRKLDGKLSHSFTETVIKTSAALIVARAVFQDGKIGFPPDLYPVSLTVPERFQNRSGPHAIIDTDSSIEQREVFELARLKNKLVTVHDEVEKAFLVAVTPHALKSWK